MTDQTPPPSDARTNKTATADRSETTAAGLAAGRDASIIVLQVEPDARSAELLEAFAARLTDRVRVRSVDRFADALDAVETGVAVDGERVAVDCVVTEQRLPDGDGIDLTERLREADPALPVVFHTTCPGEEREAAAFGAGADAYFEKGSDRGRFDAIVARICTLVDEQRAGEAAADAGSADSPHATGAPGEALRSEE
ncbi:pas domain s-box [Halorubrum californiense DSM 19288]|uniref:Pas domain s-box n=1 Tax=Halorubrum californiense DSM 19288 TaxID=1227465 RepID=M0EHB4_9EURY|nr:MULTISPECIES: response regulator [Halorubrum]ELZ46453.1 pas domain s-box [Halorubrum californiense DSM 19288]TKX70510.1 response regulator [Halorubrum sp. GN11GM_10-3_MGM]